MVLLVEAQTNTHMYSGPGRVSKLFAQVFQSHASPPREVRRHKKTASVSLRVCNPVHPEHWDSNGDQYGSPHKTTEGSQVGHFTLPLWSNTSFTALVTGLLHSQG